MNIYIIVLVTYDYYRFQTNLAVATTMEDALAKAQEAASREVGDEIRVKDGSRTLHRMHRLPIVVDDDPIWEHYQDEELRHIWIERLTT